VDTRVFVYEYLSAGGAGTGGDDQAATDDLLPQGLAMRDAMAADLAALPGVVPTLATVPGLAVPPGCAAVSPQPGESAVDFVRRESAEHDLAWVVAPETGQTLLQLSGAVAASRWLGCDAAAIRLAASKKATLRRLAGQGLATPLAFWQAAGGWVVKPDDGAGCWGARLHSDHDAAKADWCARLQAQRPAVMEPWVEGESLSLSLLCGARTRLLSINRQRIACDGDGALSFRGVDRNVVSLGSPRGEQLRRWAEDVARAVPGLRGFVGIDLVWHASRGPVVIEINPRLTSAYVGLSAALARNVAADLLALWQPERADACA
jgi:predicted ATP-grasp superfamily ATP-dependent carboligase